MIASAVSSAPLSLLLFVLGLAGGAIVLILVALVARRLLGLRVGPLRTFIAGIIGYGGGIAVAAVVAHNDRHATTTALLPVLIGFALLVTMGLLAAAEVIAPSSSPVHPVRTARLRMHRARRYGEVVSIAMHHGLGPWLRAQQGVRDGTRDTRAARATAVREAITEAGTTFVKLGQLLSTREDLLSPELATALGTLQSHAPPSDPAAVRALMEEELGADRDTVFGEFNPKPLGAASVAQAHLARLPTGEEVVVKVQRPGIADVVERDLDILLSLAETIERRAARGTSTLDAVASPTQRLGVLELAGSFADALREELDFTVEARNLEAVVSPTEDVVIPRLYRPLSSRRVLVMERLRGIELGDAGEAIDARGIDRAALARTLLDTMLTHLMIDGTFHADPHPGNVLLLEDGRLGLLDFGSVGHLDAQLRAALAQLMLAIHQGDAAAGMDALLVLVERPDELDEPALEHALGRFISRHLSGGRLRPAAFNDLFSLLSQHDLIVLPDVALGFRAFATLEGTLLELCPGLDLLGEVRRFATAQLRTTFDRKAMAQSAYDEFTTLLPILSRLPRRIDRFGAALEAGRFSVGVRIFADPRDRRVVATLLQQALLALLSASTGLMGALLLGDGAGPHISRGLGLFALLGYAALVVSFVLLLRVLVILLR